jgi:hypothetical protein
MNFRASTFLAGLTILLSSAANCQHIIGSLAYSDTHQVVGSANVTINSLPDSIVVAYAASNENGIFDILFTLKENQRYYLKVTHVNTVDKILRLDKQPNAAMQIELDSRIYVLNEVEIFEKVPARDKNDSTTYDIESFRNGSERTLEDVLKKLPNVRVESNGDIYVKNKRVEKVLLDGDDVVGSNYQLATRSIDPSILSNVQAIEHFNDNKLLQKIEISDKTVLNLTVKEEKKSLLFGNTDVGIGPRRFTGNGSHFSYQKKIKLFSILSTNNIGLQKIDVVNNQSQILTNRPVTTEQRIRMFSQTNEPFIRPLNSQLENINNEKIGALNFAISPIKPFKIFGNLMFSNDSRRQERSQFSQSLADSSIRYSQYDTLHQKPSLFQARVQASYDISKRTNVLLKGTFTENEIRLQQGTFFVGPEATLNIPQQFYNQTQEWQQVIDFTHKLTKSTAFISSIYFSNVHQNENVVAPLTLSLRNEIYPGSPSTDVSISQNILQINRLLTGRIGWVYGDDKRKFEQHFGYSNSGFNASLTQSITGNDAVKLSRNSFYTRSAINLVFNKLDVSGNIQLDAMNSKITNEQQFKPILQSKITSSYKLNKLNQLSLSYSKSINPVSNTSIINSYVVNDYRSAQQGKFNLMYDDQYQISFNYSYIDLQRRNMTWIVSLFTTHFNNLWNFADYTQATQYAVSRLINTPGVNIRGLNITGEKLIYPLLGNIKLDFKVTQNNLSQFVNNEKQVVKMLQPSATVRYVSVFEMPFNTEIGVNYRFFNFSIFQNSTETTQSYSTIIPYTKLVYNKEKCQVNVVAENYRIQQSNAFILRASVNYRLNEKINIGLEGLNLLDQRSFKQVSLDPILYSSSSINLLNRMILFRGSYIL